MKCVPGIKLSLALVHINTIKHENEQVKVRIDSMTWECKTKTNAHAIAHNEFDTY